MAGQGSERDHIYEHHLLVALGIACRKGTAVAEPRVVDQKIDIDLLALEPRHQFLQLRQIGEISFPNVNDEIWMILR